MKFDRKVVVRAYDLEEAVRMQYGVEGPIEIAPLFWPEDFQNDCLKRLNIEEDAYEWEPETEEATQRQLIRTYLRDIFPDETDILVDVSW